MRIISFRNDILPLKNELFRLALRITLDKAEAEDVVQETMIKVWNRRDDWHKIDSIEAFCLTVCRNLAIDKAKRMGAHSQTIEEEHCGDTADRSYAANPEAQAMERNSVEIVRQLVNALPEKQRSIMQLRDIEGKSYKEIAAILGVSEEQVKVNLFRARQTIKKKYIQTENYGL